MCSWVNCLAAHAGSARSVVQLGTHDKGKDRIFAIYEPEDCCNNQVITAMKTDLSVDPTEPSEPVRTRIKNRMESVAPKGSGGIPWLAGLLVCGMGAGIIALSAGWIPSDPSNFKAPRAIVGLAGAIFLGVGVMILGGAVASWNHLRRLQATAALHPEEPAFADYPWDPTGASAPRWKAARQSTLFFVFLAVFLSIFHWWAFFSKDGPLLVKLITLFFDVILVLLLWQTIKAVTHAWKFAPGRVTWNEFPIRPGQQIELFWQAPGDMTSWISGHFVLRCAEEFIEVKGSGKSRSSSLIVEEIWSQKIDVGPGGGVLAEPIRMQFDPPLDLPGSWLSAPRPVFWELELELENPGINRKERFLIPIYKTEQV